MKRTSHFIIISTLIFWMGACNKTSTKVGSATSTVTYTSDELLAALRAASLRINMNQPAAADVDALINATDKTAKYCELAKSYVTGEGLRTALVDYFRTIFGMASSTDRPQDDDPARLAAYIVMNDENYCDLVTGKYKVDANGARIEGQDANGTPTDNLAGFMTLSSWQEVYKGNCFLFNYMREIARVTECYEYPDPDKVGAWTLDQLSPKYHERDGINCASCHSTLNAKRGVFYNYDCSTTPKYRTNATKGNDLFGHEKDLFEGSPVVEPGDTAAQFTGTMKTTADYGAQLCATDRFKRCAARRGLTFALGYFRGLAGQGLGKTPFDFDSSSQAGDKDLLDTWTKELVETHNMRIRPWLAAFVCSEDFIKRVSAGSGG